MDYSHCLGHMVVRNRFSFDGEDIYHLKDSSGLGYIKADKSRLVQELNRCYPFVIFPSGGHPNFSGRQALFFLRQLGVLSGWYL